MRPLAAVGGLFFEVEVDESEVKAIVDRYTANGGRKRRGKRHSADFLVIRHGVRNFSVELLTR